LRRRCQPRIQRQVLGHWGIHITGFHGHYMYFSVMQVISKSA
jgi:hypothetical protein